MTIDASTVLPVAVIVGIFGFIVLRFVLVTAVTPQSDLARIRVELGGLQGKAGPNKQVTDIVHKGGTPGSRSSPPKRRYVVTLEDPDGSTEQRIVWVAAGFFENGEVTVERRGAW
jgi:hypothetical protein